MARKWRRWLFLVVALLGLSGCERVFLERRIYPILEVPPEGELSTLLVGSTVEVVARYPAPEAEGLSWWLYWQRADGTSAVTGSVPLSSTVLPGAVEGRFAGWPPEPLPPGRYRLWVEAEVRGARVRSGEAEVRILPADEDTAQPTLQLPHDLPQPATPTPPVATRVVPELPTPTPDPGICYRAQLVADVTLPDGVTIEVERPYTKTWRFRNTGSCPWPAETYVTWIDEAPLHPGGEINPSLAYRLGRVVNPGEVIDVSVRIVHWGDGPALVRGLYMFALPDGTTFGVGPRGDQPFWVEVRGLATPTPTPAPPTPMPDTQPPSADWLRHTPEGIAPPPCPAVLQFTLEGARDPSGIAIANLVWWLEDASRQGTVQSFPLSRTGEGTYQGTLAFDSLSASLAPPYDGYKATLYYYVRLADGAYNWATIYPDGPRPTVDSQCVQ